MRILGADHLGGAMQRYAKEIGVDDAVEFAGFVHRSSLQEHFDWATIMLHTSLYEGQGMVLAEAAARGVVVCGTDVGLIHDLHENGMVAVRPGSPEALAGEVLTLLENPRKFATLRAMAYRWAAGHTIEWTARKYAGLYQDALEGSGDDGPHWRMRKSRV
jgi:glycosyltransferase involved in cell wall biosynthesis